MGVFKAVLFRVCKRKLLELWDGSSCNVEKLTLCLSLKVVGFLTVRWVEVVEWGAGRGRESEDWEKKHRKWNENYWLSWCVWIERWSCGNNLVLGENSPEICTRSPVLWTMLASFSTCSRIVDTLVPACALVSRKRENFTCPFFSPSRKFLGCGLLPHLSHTGLISKRLSKMENHSRRTYVKILAWTSFKGIW